MNPVGVLELYASTEASAVIANAAGKKIGALGRPLPGSPELAIAAYDFTERSLVHDSAGRLVRARLDEPGGAAAPGAPGPRHPQRGKLTAPPARPWMPDRLHGALWTRSSMLSTFWPPRRPGIWRVHRDGRNAW